MKENVSARPNGLREKAETAISCTWTYQKEEREIPISREEDVETNM